MPPLLNYYKSKGGTPMEKLRNLSVLAKLIILLVLLADLSLVVPATFPVACMLFPLPLGIAYNAYGLRRCLAVIAVMTVLAGILSTPGAALMLLAFCAPFGMLTGLFFKNAWSLKRLIIISGVFSSVLFSAFFTGLYVAFDINIFVVAGQAMTTIFEQALHNAAAAGVSQVDLINARANGKVLTEIMPYMIPSALITLSLIFVYVQAQLSRLIMAKGGLDASPVLPLRYWEIGRPVLYLYVLAQVMQYWGTTRHIFWLNAGGINLDNFTFFLLSVNGLAVIFFFLERRFHVTVWTRILVILVYIFIPVPVQYLTFLLGLADALFHFRRKYRIN